MAKDMVRQDWGKWPLDMAFPMLYNEFYNADISWIGRKVKQCIKAPIIGGNVFSGLFVPSLKKNRGQLSKAISISMSSGARGVCFFDYNSIDDSSWTEIKNAIIKIKKANKPNF